MGSCAESWGGHWARRQANGVPVHLALPGCVTGQAPHLLGPSAPPRDGRRGHTGVPHSAGRRSARQPPAPSEDTGLPGQERRSRLGEGAERGHRCPRACEPPSGTGTGSEPWLPESGPQGRGATPLPRPTPSPPRLQRDRLEGRALPRLQRRRWRREAACGRGRGCPHSRSLLGAGGQGAYLLAFPPGPDTRLLVKERVGVPTAWRPPFLPPATTSGTWAANAVTCAGRP